MKATVVSTNIHYGALIGRADGTILVENVVTNVNIIGVSSTGVQGDAGMVGANYADMTFNNCATLGEIYDIVVEDMDRQSRGLKG